jgi:hypothetical protein
MQCYKFFTQDAELAEEVLAGGQRYAGKVDLQEFCIALPVCGRVENCIDVVEDVLRTEGRDKVAMAIRHELEAEATFEIFDEFEVKIWNATFFVGGPNDRIK